MNSLATRQQIRQASRAASRGVPPLRRVETLIGWIGGVGFIAILLLQIIEKVTK